MAIVNANQLVLRASTTAPSNALSPAVAHAQNASLSFSNSLIDTTTKSSNSWMQKISGQRSFSLSADGLLDYAAVSGAIDVVGAGGAGTLSALALSGAEVIFQFGIGNQGSVDQVSSAHSSSLVELTTLLLTQSLLKETEY